MIGQAIFLILLAVTALAARKRFAFISRNIRLGRDEWPSGNSTERWKTMARVALGQSKMFTRPVAALMHLLIYAGFIIINMEVLEIIIDGIFGTHRVFAFAGGLYDFLIGCFEVLAVLVVLACVVFLIRRNIIRLRRFHLREMTRWPRTDANLILVTEILLMAAFLHMNAADFLLQQRMEPHYVQAGAFPVSSWLAGAYTDWESSSLILLERFCWWFHIAGIFAFVIYLTWSKHLHIILAFPTTWYSKLEPAGRISNLDAVTREVKLMLDPQAEVPPSPPEGAPSRFGAKDVPDLTRVQLMSAYACTECGRCTSECPANQTGKLLSPRKIMMDTRDRMEEIGRRMDASGKWEDDGRSLLRDYITEEEIWACTTCNACTEACPVNINPMEIILDLRRYLIMEESRSPESITAMFNNIENNGAPWAMSASDRANWTHN